MSTLESQYKAFIERNPDSTFTYDEWLKWFGNELVESLAKLRSDDDKNNG